MFQCPDCGHVSPHPEDKILGYCAHCREFTGLCGAGRRVILLPTAISDAGSPEWMQVCTQPQTERWRVVLPDDSATDTGLCHGHGEALAPLIASGRVLQARRIDVGQRPARRRGTSGVRGVLRLLFKRAG
jgi:hypothetical protein